METTTEAETNGEGLTLEGWKHAARLDREGGGLQVLEVAGLSEETVFRAWKGDVSPGLWRAGLDEALFGLHARLLREHKALQDLLDQALRIVSDLPRCDASTPENPRCVQLATWDCINQLGDVYSACEGHQTHGGMHHDEPPTAKPYADALRAFQTQWKAMGEGRGRRKSVIEEVVVTEVTMPTGPSYGVTVHINAAGEAAPQSIRSSEGETLVVSESMRRLTRALMEAGRVFLETGVT